MGVCGWEEFLINCGKCFKEYGQRWGVGRDGVMRAFPIFRIETQNNSIYGTVRGGGDLVILRKGILLVQKASINSDVGALFVLCLEDKFVVQRASSVAICLSASKRSSVAAYRKAVFHRRPQVFSFTPGCSGIEAKCFVVNHINRTAKKRSSASSYLSVCPSV